jgi:endonuclease YncB( thermonuclease family)
MSRRHLLTKKNITLLTTVVAALLAGLSQAGVLPQVGSIAYNATQNQPGLYAVARFIDGDTIAVDMNGKTESVRMIGIDTPETHKPNSPVQCYGPAASAYTKNLIGSSKVRLEADSKNTNRDRYDRLLRYVYLPDGRLVAKELISHGYAFAYTQFPFSKTDDFVSAEASAKQANLGLWSNCTVTVEQNGRKQTNNL